MSEKPLREDLEKLWQQMNKINRSLAAEKASSKAVNKSIEKAIGDLSNRVDKIVTQQSRLHDHQRDEGRHSSNRKPPRNVTKNVKTVEPR